MKTTKDNLLELRKLLTKRSAWTAHALARTVYGSETTPRNQHAVCWCLLGGIQKIAQTQTEIYNLQAALTENLPSGYYNLAILNDGSSHKDVLTLIDKAILEEKPV